MLRLSGHLKQVDKNLSTPTSLLQHLRECDIVDAYPNVEVALRIYLTLPASNTEGERSFSVLKRLKNRLRCNISQDKLSDTSILTIESDITEALKCEKIIDNFATSKARKKIV